MQTHKPLVIVLLGPTASGKTSLGIELAKKLSLKIHNVDSRQVYIGMDIGTAKPTLDQQNEVEHLLIDIRKPNHPINVWEFQKAAEISLKTNLDKDGKAILVGGSGLYLKSLIGGLQPHKDPPQENFRKQLNLI